MEVSRTGIRNYHKQRVKNLNRWFMLVCLKVLGVAMVAIMLAIAMMLGISKAVEQHEQKVAAIRQGVIFDE